MTPFSDPWVLDGLGILLIAVGSAGLVALFVSSPRPVAARSIGVACAVLAISGILLMTRAETLRDADRDLNPAQLAEIAKVMGRFPDIRFEVLTAHTDNETRSLAAKVVEAVKAGTGMTPAVGDIPPGPLKGVVLVLRDRETDFGRAVASTLGRALMAARVATITDDEASLDNRTVRIVVGEKP